MNNKVKRGPKRIVYDPVIKTIQLEKLVLQDLEKIAEDQDCSLTALIRQVLTDYVFSQLNPDK
jgi:predicted DNA-binding ribbon-helix-helix protein